MVARKRLILGLGPGQQEGLAAVRVYLETVWGEAAARFRLVAENTDRRP